MNALSGLFSFDLFFFAVISGRFVFLRFHFVRCVGIFQRAGFNFVHTQQHKQASDHLCALTEFALAMRSRLQELNVHSFNNFQLRVGLSVGALVGGVIGAKKPVFDVWGDTVNEASRMESTGRLDAIQISKVGADILAAQRYPVQRRGVIHVKGKGNMETYFVYGKSLSPQTECNGTWLASNVTTTATGGMAADTSDKSTSNIGGSLLEKNLSNASTTAVGSGLGAMAGGVTMTGSSIVMGGGAGVPGTTAVTGGAGASSSCGGSSLAEVMFNMVQVRKKQTLAGSLSVPQATPSIGSNKAQPKHGRLNFTLRSGTSSGTGGIALDDELSTESGGVGDSSNLLMGLSGLDRAHLSSGPFRSGFRLQRIKSEKPANRKSGHKRKYLSKIRLSDGFADFNSSNFRGTLLDFAARHRNGNNNVPIDTPHAPIVSRATAAGSQSAVNIPPESFASSDLNELQQKLISTSGSIDGSNDAIVLGTKIASSDTGSGQSSPQTTTEQLIEMRNCRSVSPTVTTSNRSIRKRDKQVDYL